MNGIIISSIITATLGIIFLIFGITMRKNNKIPGLSAKANQKSIDNPHETSLIFFYLAVLGITLSLYILSMHPDGLFNEYFKHAIQKIFFVVGFMGPTLLIICGIYGLKKYRVFGYKNTKETKRFIKKYYKINNYSMIITGIFGILAPLSVILNKTIQIPSIISTILWIICAISIFIMVITMTITESKYKNSLKK